MVSKETTKFLGLLVDANLRWSDHVDHISKKLSQSLYAIRRMKNLLPLKALLGVYYSLVYSHIAYNIIVWGNSVDFNRVFIAQKRILRTMFGLHPRDSCKPFFIEHKILTAPCIYMYKCLVYVNENIRDSAKLKNFHGYGTRNAETLSVPRHNTTKFETSPRYQGIKLFNRLPDTIKTLNRVGFRKAIKALLLKNCYYSVKDFLNDDFLNVYN